MSIALNADVWSVVLRHLTAAEAATLLRCCKRLHKSALPAFVHMYIRRPKLLVEKGAEQPFGPAMAPRVAAYLRSYITINTRRISAAAGSVPDDADVALYVLTLLVHTHHWLAWRQRGSRQWPRGVVDQQPVAAGLVRTCARRAIDLCSFLLGVPAPWHKHRQRVAIRPRTLSVELRRQLAHHALLFTNLRLPRRREQA